MDFFSGGKNEGVYGKIVDEWRNRYASLEVNFKRSLELSSAECKETLRDLSLALLDKLKKFENQFSSIQQNNKEQQIKLIEKWKNTIKTWKKEVFGIKCHQKIYLSNLIRKHCDFLLNLNQYHPEYIKWRISRLILETNEVIILNDNAFRDIENSLFERVSLALGNEDELSPTDKDIDQTTDVEKEKHDQINVNYDDYELEEERKRRGELLIDDVEDLRTDTSYTFLLDLLAKLRDKLSNQIPTFKNYDISNEQLETAVDHIENCKDTLISMSVLFMDQSEPILRQELVDISTKLATNLSTSDRHNIERWMECILFFEYLLNKVLMLLRVSSNIWNQHVCRIITMKQIILDILKGLLVKQNQQQMKFEQKINIYLDDIREASTIQDIDANINKIEQCYFELEYIYNQTYQNGIDEANEFLDGIKLIKVLFCSKSTLYMKDVNEISDFPGHGSETEVVVEPMQDLQHWELLKQNLISLSNWYQGIGEGVYLLCKAEMNSSNYYWVEGLHRYLAWVKDLKQEILKRRKDRLHPEFAMPRILELQAHEEILFRHKTALNNVFAERPDIEYEFKCNLLTMTNKIEREYEAILNYTNINDDYHRVRFLGRINELENHIENIVTVKQSLTDDILNKIKKKYLWLQKANYGILKHIRLFGEGGNFSENETKYFIGTISKLQSDISNDEKEATDTIMSIAKSINPTKNIDIQPLNMIREMVHYKTKKDSAHEIAEELFAKLNKDINSEIAKARDVCSDLCNFIKCFQIHDELILRFAGVASYLKYPTEESSLLECEDANYMNDLIDSDITLVDINKENEIKEKSLSFIDWNAVNKDDVCDELIAAAEMKINKEKVKGKGKGKAHVKSRDGDRKKSKYGGKGKNKNNKTSRGKEEGEGSDEAVETRILRKDEGNLAAASIERKDVIRDTLCEQLKRLKEQQRKENEDKDKEHGKDIEEEKADDNNDGDKTNSKQKSKKKKCKKKPDGLGRGKSAKEGNSTKDKSQDKNAKDRSNKQEDGNLENILKDEYDNYDKENILEEIFAGGYLYKYTTVPIEMGKCNFLLFTKKVIFEHFVKIQKIVQKFFVNDEDDDDYLKTKSKDYSPEDDFKALTLKLLQKMRILNIQCEHAWITLVHDFLVLLRAYQTSIEEKIENDFSSIENKWKLDYCKIITDSENTLNQAVVSVPRRSEELLRQFYGNDCKESNDFEQTLSDRMKTHCSDHIDEIKTIWLDLSKELKEKYLEFKQDLADLSLNSLSLRNSLSEDEAIVSFFEDLKLVSNRFYETINSFLHENENDCSVLQTKLKCEEMNKVKSLQFLLKIILTIIQDFNTNYFAQILSQNSSDISVFSPIMIPEIIDCRSRMNKFLQEVATNIRKKHGCFRKICIEQICITMKWLKQWQSEKRQIT